MTASRLALPFLNIGHALDHFFMLIFPTAVLALGPELGLPYEELLPLATVGFIALGLGTLPAGWLGDRWSRRGMMIVFFLGIGAASILTGFARSTVEIACGLGLIGLFAAIYHPVGIPMVVASSDRVGRTLAINGVFGNLGLAGAAIVTGALTELIGWQAAFIIPGCVSIAAGIAFALLVRGDYGDPVQKSVAPVAAPRAVQVKVFAMVAVGSVLGGVLFHAGTVALPKIFADRAGGLASGITEVGGLVSIVFAVAAIAQIPVGWLLDRHPVRWIQLAIAGAQVVLLLLAVSATNWALLFVAMPLLFAIFGEIPIGDWLVARYTADRWRSRAYAMTYVFSLSDSVAVAALVAWLYGASGGFGTLFLVMAGCSALMGVAALFLLPATRPAPAAIPVAAE
jgi:MFS family permease